MYRARYRRIVSFFGRVIIGLILWDLVFPRIGLRGLAKRTRADRLRKIAGQFRALATQMGGVLIKVGQFLSSRVDVLPQEITDELANLQDEVAPEDYEDIRRVAEAELGGTLSEQFLEFEEYPLAAASLGQVHRAKLHKTPGVSENARGLRDVVVKVQRPDIERIIATDIAALRTVGKWMRRYRPISRRADVPALLNEFTRTLYEEIDYLAEGKNAETFAANFRNRPGVRVPSVVWTHTTKRVLVLEDVYAIKITDYEAITAAGIDRAEVAQRLFDTYLQQIFEDGFFHADPHPGNLFVTPVANSTHPSGLPPTTAGDGSGEWLLTFVDFGMVGRVPPHLRAGLREMVIGVGMRDSARLIKSYQMLGVLLPHADLKLIEEMESQVFDRFWGKSMAELQKISLGEMHEFAREYREIIYSMPFQVPGDIIYLVRCVAILSGMCTGLNPDFNVWEGLTPFAQRIIADEAVHGWEYWLEEIGTWGRALINIPRRLDAALLKMERGEIAVDTPTLNQHAARLEKSTRQLSNAVVFAVLLLSGVQLYLAEEVLFAGILSGGALIALVRMFFGRRGK
ncbi:MAG: AarF/ABC1/UbiB kinase family protein [Chloroflexi bacterium]|nr:AarF/ABC1/UbiB kinase family protein [Chloroflexota bacterium]